MFLWESLRHPHGRAHRCVDLPLRQLSEVIRRSFHGAGAREGDAGGGAT